MSLARRSLFWGIQKTLSAAGLRISFDRAVRNVLKLVCLKASERGVNTVLDIGANRGQFALDLRRHGYRGAIVSFEPLSSAHAILRDASMRDSLWHIAPRMALGEIAGSAEINIAKNLASSSLLPVLERSVLAAAVCGYSGTESTPVRRLDDVLETAWRAPFALKLDTQGFELHVLHGALNTLAGTEVVVAEMSLVDLYQGGARFVDVFGFLEDCGFRCISLVQGFADDVRHQLLQVDGVFVRDR